MGCNFEPGRNNLAGLVFSRAGPNLTNFGEIRMIRAESQNHGGDPWWLTNVYGPTERADKADFLQEIRDTRSSI
jgi:hypothetical protein